MRSAKALIRLRGHTGSAEFAGRTSQTVGFVVRCLLFPLQKFLNFMQIVQFRRLRTIMRLYTVYYFPVSFSGLLCISRLKLVVLTIKIICTYQGPVVQSVVSLTSSLRVISLTVLADSIYNILIFFAEKIRVAFALQKLLTFFQQKKSAYLRITGCKF